MAGEIIYLGEWIRTKARQSKYMNFRPCSICKSLLCKMVWMNLTTKEVMCMDCFDAEKEHYTFKEFTDNGRKK